MWCVVCRVSESHKWQINRFTFELKPLIPCTSLLMFVAESNVTTFSFNIMTKMQWNNKMLLILIYQQLWEEMRAIQKEEL